METIGRVQIDRIVIENFRSIRQCDVGLGNLTVLVGKNGSGKSSFLDALSFIRSALAKGVSAAIVDRNGLTTLLYRPTVFPATIAFKLWFSGSVGLHGSFEMQVVATSWTEFTVRLEACEVSVLGDFSADFRVSEGIVSGSIPNLPPAPLDRLYLSAVSGFVEFRQIYRLLAGFGFSGYDPKGVHLILLNRFPKSYTFPSQVTRLINGDPNRRKIVEEYIRLIVPSFARLDVEMAGGREWVAFVENVGAGETRFYVPQISDGTLYATSLMLDLFLQSEADDVTLPIFLDEPGGSLHPWAVGILRGALLEAAKERQVIFTTHSPELLDGSDIPALAIRAVYRDSNGTHIERLNENISALITEGACTPGELFRRGVLASDNEPEFAPFLA